MEEMSETDRKLIGGIGRRWISFYKFSKFYKVETLENGRIEEIFQKVRKLKKW